MRLCVSRDHKNHSIEAELGKRSFENVPTEKLLNMP